MSCQIFVVKSLYTEGQTGIAKYNVVHNARIKCLPKPDPELFRAAGEMEGEKFKRGKGREEGVNCTKSGVKYLKISTFLL